VIKLIIFDWDDVFTLGSKEGYIKCLHDTLVELGVYLDPAEEHRRILDTWPLPHRDQLVELMRERPELLEPAVDLYEVKFFGNTFVGLLRYLLGANKLLARLKAEGYIMAVATGAHPILMRERILPRFKVPPVFSQMIYGYDLTELAQQKPHPYMLTTIMNELHARPDETIFVGDAKQDVQMARNAGVKPVVVLTGQLNRLQAAKMGVTHVIPDVLALPAVLDEFHPAKSEVR
jgi:phosphoglycolate phosphatase-like HAD superfamily hydrolase